MNFASLFDFLEIVRKLDTNNLFPQIRHSGTGRNPSLVRTDNRTVRAYERNGIPAFAGTTPLRSQYPSL